MLLGQSVEYKIASMLLGEGREIYLPVVDDHGVDMLVAQSQSKTPSYQELQIKSVSKGGLFAAITCNNPRPNYWFVFYVKSIDKIWLINSTVFVQIASQNKQGKNCGKYSLSLATKGGKIRHHEYVVKDFSKLP